MSDYYRGHKIHYSNGAYRFSDTGGKVSDRPYRECGYCGKERTKEGHDGCLGTLPGVMNACCGHGKPKEAYIQFLDGYCIRGLHAINIMNIMSIVISNANSPSH